MPGLYGNSGSDNLYGSGFLSDRNQAQAKQLGLPEAQSSNDNIAGSQQEAQSDWANFEDIFNKNRGYAQKGAQALSDKVKGAVGPEPMAKLAEPAQGMAGVGMKVGTPQTSTSSGEQQAAHIPAVAPEPQGYSKDIASKGAPPAANPQAPLQLQAPSLTGIQSKMDLLQGYGNPGAPQVNQQGQTGEPAPAGVNAVHGGRQQKLGGEPQTATSQSADTGETNNPPDDKNPFVTGNYNTDTPATPEPQKPPPDPRDTDGNGQISALEQFEWDRNHADQPPPDPAADAAAAAQTAETDALKAKRDQAAKDLAGAPSDEITDEEKKRVAGLTKANDLLKAWGTDAGQDLLGGGAWDAAITEAGGGRAARDALTKQYGGKDQQLKDELVKRAADAHDYKDRTQQQLSIFDSLLNNRPQAGGAAGPAGAPGTPGPGSGPYGTFHDLMGSDQGPDASTELHNIGLSLSPADQALIAAGRAGTYKGQVAAEFFRSKFGMGDDLDRENIKIALQEISKQFDPTAAQWAYENLSPANLADIKGANYGYIVHVLYEMLRAHGSKTAEEQVDDAVHKAQAQTSNATKG